MQPLTNRLRRNSFIAATGATLLFLPPYSPDFNPIEQDFAALTKHREYHETASLEEIVKAYQYIQA